jgi:hypothetical protein
MTQLRKSYENKVPSAGGKNGIAMSKGERFVQ